jgi:predicted acylesterase/phospholipase RssA
MFDAVVFAGGGNRCYWQGGFYEAAAPRLGLAPELVVGASAGAFAAIYSLLGTGAEVRALVYSAAGPHLKNFDLAAWRRGQPLCAAALRRLNEITNLAIALTRLPRGLPPLAGSLLGIGAYQLEKYLLHPVHPRFGRALGFRPEFVSARDIGDAGEMQSVLLASSGVPPFMPVTRIRGAPAFDGGLVDNVPVEPLAAVEAAGGHTLVLLTRLYNNVPEVSGRSYVQPSQKIDLSQFDITNPDGIRAAYELGLRDGKAFAASMGR